MLIWWLIPVALTLASSYLAFGYTVALSIYTGYNTISNAYSLYQSYTANNAYTYHKLESLSAYRDNYEWLYNKTGIEFLRTKAIKQTLKVNSIKYNADKESLKSQLIQLEREFGAKLYKIYDPFIIPKCKLAYELLSKVTLEKSSVGEAQDLQEPQNLFNKHLVSISITDTVVHNDYELCRCRLDTSNTEGLELNNTSLKSYYCANTETRSIHHGDASEILE